MLQESFVSLKIANLLKEKGFNEPCVAHYRLGLAKEGLLEIYKHSPEDILAPTQQMTIKWLREIYKIHIIAEPCLNDEGGLNFNKWFWTILLESGEYKPIRRIEQFPTYEIAIDDAIQFCIETLI